MTERCGRGFDTPTACLADAGRGVATDGQGALPPRWAVFAPTGEQTVQKAWIPGRETGWNLL